VRQSPNISENNSLDILLESLLSVYLPTIREALTDSGIDQLKVDSTPARTWLQPLEVVIDTASKRLR
jgi:hypothetical protein